MNTSPELLGLNWLLSKSGSFLDPSGGGLVFCTRDLMISGPSCRVRSSLATLIRTGELNALTLSPSPPLTVMFWLNVTGTSKVVTREPISSSSSSESSSAALSRNSSSPVIALILRLPMYSSPLELIPV